MCTERTESLDAIAPERWAAAGGEEGFLLSHAWLRSGVEAPSRRAAYFLVSEAAAPVAAAATYLVGPTAFGCYDPNWVSSGGHELLAGPQASYREGLYPVLSCVAPGHSAGVHVREDVASDAAIDALLDGVDELAVSWSAPVQSFLYLQPGRHPRLEAALLARDYQPFTASAESVLEVRWPGFDGYLAGLGQRRRQRLREIVQFTASGLRLERSGVEGLTPDLAELQAQVRARYGHPVDVDAIRADHARIRDHLGSRVLIFHARRDGRTVGFALFYAHGDALWSRPTGFDYASLGDDYCYFNVLFYEPVRAAIERGLRRIHYGMGAYEAKATRGGKLTATVGYIRYPRDRAAELRAQLRRYDEAERRFFGDLGLSIPPWPERR